MNVKVDHILDVKGLSCPMPVVETTQKIKKLKPGEVLEVHSTDRGSIADIAAWANSSGEQYLGIVEEGETLRHFLRKAKPEEVSEPTTFKNIANHNELKNVLNNKNVTVVDVREPAEYAFNHIPNAISIPLGEIANRASELSKDNDIYVICRTGNRSDFAAKILANKGFENVKNVIPGMTQWDGEVNTINGGN